MSEARRLLEGAVDTHVHSAPDLVEAITYVENEAAAWDTLTQVRAHGSDGFVVRVDVSRPEDIGRMLGGVRGEFGRLDILVSNARGARPGRMSIRARAPGAARPQTRPDPEVPGARSCGGRPAAPRC